MSFFRKKSQPPAEKSLGPTPVDDPRRQTGPWDVTEVADGVARVDFASLKVAPLPGMEMQLAGDGERFLALLLLHEGSALELRPLAATKGGGDWQGRLATLRAEIEERGTEVLEREGPFGTELLTEFPAHSEDGKELVQPVRFLGVEGKRWLLQAAILGPAGMETNDSGGLVDVLRAVVVERGSEPRALGELLPLKSPELGEGDPDDR